MWSCFISWRCSVGDRGHAVTASAADREVMLQRMAQLKANSLQAIAAGRVEQQQSHLKGAPARSSRSSARAIFRLPRRSPSASCRCGWA